MLYFTMINQVTDLNHLFINPFAQDLGFYFVNQDIFKLNINNIIESKIECKTFLKIKKY